MNPDATYSAYSIVSAPAALAVSVDTVRAHLRNEELSFDDDLITQYINAATGYVERSYGMALITQTIEQYHSSFPYGSDPLYLRISPFQEITYVKYLDSAGGLNEWTSDEFQEGDKNQSRYIMPKSAFAYPTDLDKQPNAVTIRYIAGFGDADTDIPAAITSALLLIIADMYQRREDNVVNLPKASEYLLLPWYRWAA